MGRSLRYHILRKYNISKAKAHLSKLLTEAVASGESFVITRAGKPIVKVSPVDPQDLCKELRIGFLSGGFSVPDDFDHIGSVEIESDFVGENQLQY